MKETYTLSDPTEKQEREIIRVNYIESIIWFLIQAIMMGVLFFCHDYFGWKSWIMPILIGITILLVVNKIFDLILPFYRYHNFRYQADEAFLYIKSGAIFEKREVVPMTKIQAVQTDQGPLLRRYNLYTVTVSTMGTTHGMTGLKKDVAFALRDEIARYAKIKEEDE